MAPAANRFPDSASLVAARAGWQPVPYRTGDRCPCCGHSNFYMGRRSAECANCATPLPIPIVGAEREKN